MDLADDALRDRARRAGIAPDWTDVTGQARSVAPETLERLLALIGADEPTASVPPLVTGVVHQAIPLPPEAGTGAAVLVLESGDRADITVHPGDDGRCWVPPIDRPGYHRLHLGNREITLAVAPPRCFGLDEVARSGRMWGLAAQIYGLRRPGDGGIGDSRGIVELTRAAGRAGADALALSPTHALFTAEPERFGPYSPSSRLFLNPLLADPAALFGQGRVAAATRTAGVAEAMRRCEAEALIDWPEAARAKQALFRALFDGFDASAGGLAEDFAGFVRAGGALLQDHARFEALQAARLAADPADRDWRRWPAALRDPAGAAVAEFAAAQDREVRFHLFLQWLADRAFAAAQAGARSAGMRIGLIADLAVGMDATGSHAWSRPADVLGGASIGSPPDAFNADGQNWTLAAISPRAMVETGFAPFLDTLRATLRHAGGIRIDHVMGLARLWLVPDGMAPTEGAYLTYPAEDLLRLVALESHRHRAVVIGEDLGTLPWGFAGRLADHAVAGMRVLWFEREGEGFKPAERWDAGAVAMSSTHDLPPVAGWWRGTDIAARAELGQYADSGAAERARRAADRGRLWQAVGAGAVPEETGPVVDAAVRFVTRGPSRLALVPLEDALGLDRQPNLPGTINEYPNWRRRLDRTAAEALADPAVAARLAAIRRERQR
ncbi:4-alpha-glucanotransferase [Inquilinus sp. NPDC058860]|uniref:4-alpha-glucanotransferase n=1 Tax=Inquilinus sp. NPDC058860 TaxID=3346652 RepID=UPI00367D6A4B